MGRIGVFIARYELNLQTTFKLIVVFRANTEIVPIIQSCYCMLLMQTPTPPTQNHPN